MDVTCMGCGELELVYGGDGHGWSKNSMGLAKGIGDGDVGLWGCAQHVKEGLQL